MSVNMASVMAKVNAKVNSSSVQKKIKAKIDQYGEMAAAEAAEDFIQELKGEIANSAGAQAFAGQLGPTAVSALSDLSAGTPSRVKDGVYEIGVNFNGDLHRDSLEPTVFDGVDNIADLLNAGYSIPKDRRQVYGTWHGRTTAALQNRAGAEFIDNAIRGFTSAGSSKNYKIVEIKKGNGFR